MTTSLSLQADSNAPRSLKNKTAFWTNRTVALKMWSVSMHALRYCSRRWFGLSCQHLAAEIIDWAWSWVVAWQVAVACDFLLSLSSVELARIFYMFYRMIFTSDLLSQYPRYVYRYLRTVYYKPSITAFSMARTFWNTEHVGRRGAFMRCRY